MPNSLKTNLDQVLAESGFQKPDSYIGNSEQDVAQIVAVAQVAALELAELALQTLRATWALTLTSATTYALPTDWLGFVPDTAYQHGRWDRIDLPTTEPLWAFLQSTTGLSSLPIRARIIGDQLNIINPQSGAVVNIEYYSNAPITNSGGTNISQFAADTDTWRLDDRMFQLEVKWRFKKEKGLADWQADNADALHRKSIVEGRTAGNSTIVPSATTVSGEPFTNQWVT